MEKEKKVWENKEKQGLMKGKYRANGKGNGQWLKVVRVKEWEEKYELLKALL